MKRRRRRRSGGLHTTTTTTTTTTLNSSSSSNKFGSFIILASAEKHARGFVKRLSEQTEHSLIMLSSVSESESGESGESDEWPWRRSKHGKVLYHLGGSKELKVELDNNNNINNNLGLGGGGGEGSSNDDDDQQQQQQLVVPLKLKSLAVPSLIESFCFKKERVSSCEGLVCLHDEFSNLFCLWNPATQKHRILPKPKQFGAGWSKHLFAFGFDVETKDYRVVLLTGLGGMFYRPISPIECICRVQVYSLSTDSWRLLEGITCLPGEPFRRSNEALYVNGSCFFLAQFFRNRDEPCFPESDRFIISFDFTKETITPIQLPDHHQDQKLYLSSLGDELALFTKSYYNGTCEDYSVWVLKEHNGSSSSSSIRSVNKESWTKLHSFQIEPIRPSETHKPIGLSNDGEFALLETCGSSAFGKKIKLYHFATEEVKSFLSCNWVMSKAIAYKPSLVSIIGGNGAAAAAAAATAAPIG